MSQDWNTVMNRVLALQAAEAEEMRAAQRVLAAANALNEAIHRDGPEFCRAEHELRFVVGDREFVISVPEHARGPARVQERQLRVINLAG